MTTPVPKGPFFAADCHLDPEDAKAFHNLEDLLGPYGTPALHQVVSAAYEQGRHDDGYERTH